MTTTTSTQEETFRKRQRAEWAYLVDREARRLLSRNSTRKEALCEAWAMYDHPDENRRPVYWFGVLQRVWDLHIDA